MKTRLILTAMACTTVLFACEEKKEAPKATDATKAVGDAVKKAGETTKDAAKAATDATKDAAAKATEATKDAAAKAGEAVKDTAKTATDAAKDAGAKAVAALTDEAKKSFESYSKDLGSFGTLLEGIKSKTDAMTKAGDVTKGIASVNAGSAALDKLSPDAKTALMNSFKAQLDPMTKKVQDQVARLTADKDLGAMLSEGLKGLKLFK